jgi:ribosomal protein L30/L7E
MATEPKKAAKPAMAKRAAPKPASKSERHGNEVTMQTPVSNPVATSASVERNDAPAAQAGGRLAIVLIRNRTIGVRHDVHRALDRLRLRRRHICSVFPDNASVRGLMFKCKDLTTYGPISEETLKLLNEKRGSLKDRDGKTLNVFRMHPPRGGYGHKGIKVGYQEGGCLGLRRKGMDAFLAKMM